MGLQLIGDDIELQAAIRRELELARTPAPRAGGGPRTRSSRHGVDDLVAKRRKLLRLYYDDKVGADLFAEEEARLSVAIREAQRESDDARVEVARSDDVAQHFDAVAQLLATLDVDKTWRAATDVERRVLIDEFIEEITVLPDYLDVKVHGAPAVHVLYQEVGLKESRVSIVSEGGLEPPRPCGHQPLKTDLAPVEGVAVRVTPAHGVTTRHGPTPFPISRSNDEATRPTLESCRQSSRSQATLRRR